MSNINIPTKVIPGFKIISELNEEEVDKLIAILEKINIGIRFEELEVQLQSLFKPDDAQMLVFTFISFSSLFENDVNFNTLANALSASYYKNTGQESEIKKLENNLIKIFTKSHNLLITLKAKDLAQENENTLLGIKVISDIRPVFNFDLKNESRSALILHQLHCTFRKGNSNKDIFITVDTEDLKLISKSIERALKKDEILRNEYSLNFKFAN